MFAQETNNHCSVEVGLAFKHNILLKNTTILYKIYNTVPDLQYYNIIYNTIQDLFTIRSISCTGGLSKFFACLDVPIDSFF